MRDLDLKVLIADDDDGMRLMLRKAIEKHTGFNILAEAKNGEEALDMFEELSPELVFMDVEMPVIGGVECAKRILDINPKIYIIFATAHEEYMHEAFELYAFDYLLKPFNMVRVNKTLDRIKAIGTESVEFDNFKELKGSISKKKLMVKNKESLNLIDVEEIIFIQREDRTTVIYTKDERHVTSEGLTEIEDRLDKALFFRAHKSYIINVAMIQKIFPYGRWTYSVTLKGTQKDALMTHDKYEMLQKIFNG